jgi:hypothetical protein
VRLAGAPRRMIQSWAAHACAPSMTTPQGTSMKTLLSVIALFLGCLSLPALAADAPASAPLSQQQSKMTTCNADAAGMKGDERKAFMKDCLSAKKPTQQDRMKSCNAEAQGKKGDERKAFMKACLST